MAESAEIVSASSRGEIYFLKWLKQKPEKTQRKIFIIFRKNNIILKRKHLVDTKKKTTATEREAPRKKENIYFVGGSYQNLDARYLPSSGKNQSGQQAGFMTDNLSFILEKRNETFTGGFSGNFSYLQVFAGNRYKPIPQFYFAKDPDFYSAFDGKNSPLPQPILTSYFLGFSSQKEGAGHRLGIYHSTSVSPEPGIYYVSPNRSYSFTWAPHSRIGSLLINDRYSMKDWNLSLQGEGMGRSDQFFGFIYGKIFQASWDLHWEGTAYRDGGNLLSLPVNEMVDRVGVRQDLQYTRLRWKKYYVLEALQSLEGLRYESGYGIHFPIFSSDYGALVLRYRDYRESGISPNHSFGRGLFYEWRKDSYRISLGTEAKEKKQEWEVKLSFPLMYGYLLEMSGIYRDKNIKMRSWFENWSFATNFNINLTERNEIWKLRLIGKEFSVNLSLSQRADTVTYIYYANIQFLHQF
ncbi:hypothetical protein [Leptospira idonii]|uniref:Uncharacterized protein n=1 Tax=Leptospira idonii TaxID=1193500 RepID=A0A4R9LY29_9LEPT|nr:hypothetical protein [Leptospira idonii]TGN19200.1 hypothetical protein EHS15_09785 [Leptospira idonii]